MASDEEEDYMTMNFEEAPKPKQHETSLQRAARRRREGEMRSRQKTKEEKAADEAAAREAALSTALPTNNKGFKMMAKFGFKPGDALGKSENARKVPISVDIKEDRGGIGMESEKKRKFRELAEAAEREAKRSKSEDVDYREQQRQQMREKKLERDLYNTQKTAERLHDEASGGNATEIPLKNVNVLWRAPVKRRMESLRVKQQDQNLKNSLLAKPPTYEDSDEDEDDKIALGREPAPFLDDDLEEEDAELEAFEALPMEEQLQKVVLFLREKYHYCYWCGHRYDDAAMDGCPGETEEEHD